MQLSPSAFNDFLNCVGQHFDWRSAYACPCINPHSGSPDQSCPHCLGKGRFWSEPVLGTAGIVGQSQLKKFSQLGVWEDGDTMLSIPSDSPLYDIAQYDRVIAINRSEPFSINLISGINDSLRFSVLSLDRVFWIDADKNLIENDIPVVGPGGTLIWGAEHPPSQVTFSLTGRRVPEYFVYMDIPFDRPFFHGVKLPRRVVLRRFDLYGR